MAVVLHVKDLRLSFSATVKVAQLNFPVSGYGDAGSGYGASSSSSTPASGSSLPGGGGFGLDGGPPLQKATSQFSGHSTFYASSFLNSIGSPPGAYSFKLVNNRASAP
jgi:hypothetical protein